MKPIAATVGWLATVLAITFLNSCSSVPRAGINAALAGTGAFIGHEVADGEPEGALLGAASGVIAGELLNHKQETGKRPTPPAITKGGAMR